MIILESGGRNKNNKENAGLEFDRGEALQLRPYQTWRKLPDEMEKVSHRSEKRCFQAQRMASAKVLECE